MVRQSCDRELLLSAGIDVGTTTTHLTISRLHLANRSLLNQAPRLAVAAREIVYRSAIHFTPLSADGRIDAEAVLRIVSSEYRQAGIDPGEVSTGAVIVTGETARLRNARAVADRLAQTAGQFVSASAGPNLEGILAGRGSGAAEASAAGGRTICNIDVGGGTANFAVFADGQPVDAAALSVGGRCLRLDRDRRLVAVTGSGELLLDALGKDVPLGLPVDEEMLELIGHLLAESIIQYPLGRRPPQVSERLLVTDPLKRVCRIDEFWFSGGVAELMQSPPADPLAYGDIGAYLASGLMAAVTERALPFRIPERPICATVIGAGTFSLQLSGSTVSVDRKQLPLRNLPIVRPFSGDMAGRDRGAWVSERLANCLRVNDIDWSSQPVAITLETLPPADFETLAGWAAALARAFVELGGAPPLVLVAGQDLAMALGQLIRQHLRDMPLVILDGIRSTDGDLIDIGLPLAGNQAIPVVVKCLLFQEGS